MSGAYHHGDLRSALVEAGLAAAREGGAGAVSLREITRTVGVTPNAAYRHFADRQAIVLTVALEAQHRLARAIRDRMDAAAGADAAVARLRAFALAYVDFAVAEPGWFELACLSQDAPPDPSTPAPYELLLAALDDAVAAGALAADRRSNAEWVCWTAAHGFATLATSGPLQGLRGEPLKSLAAHVVETTIRGLTAPA
ncbi:TetR/AcrR family transcriptional regulator [Fodinicola acaciae]|uniref:TetR/AcrR family transcriptional regulator n=1 Tax=Fodinicola acaciae TaxID=2681555 RepID=UPI0013D2B3D3|nr:TetR-like C-terminal domain-containing protein [Fodinicola acaciae]